MRPALTTAAARALAAALLAGAALTAATAQQAERVSSLGIKGGLATYYGELNDGRLFPATPESANLFDGNLDYVSWGLDYEQYLGDSWGIGLVYTNSEFTALDRAVDWSGDPVETATFARSLNVRTKINDLALYGIWSANNGKLLSEDAFLAPYVKLGVGLTRYRPFGDLLSDNGSRYIYAEDGSIRNSIADGVTAPTQLDGVYETELRDLETSGESYGKYALSLLGGVGLNFRFGDHFSLQLESLVRPTATDFLDDVGGGFLDADAPVDGFRVYASNPSGRDGLTRGEDGRDWYAFHNLSARFYFGDRADDFRSPVIILGELPLADSTAGGMRLFAFEAPEPLQPIALDSISLPAPVQLGALELRVPEVRQVPAAPEWADSDGDEAPAIESEVPADYEPTYDFESAYSESTRTRTTTGGNTAGVGLDTFRRSPAPVVTALPRWASDEELQLDDSLSRAVDRLPTSLPDDDLAARRARIDSIETAVEARSARIDSLSEALAAERARVDGADATSRQITDTLRIVERDTVRIGGVDSVAFVARDSIRVRTVETQTRSAAEQRRIDELQRELDRLRAEQRRDIAVREDAVRSYTTIERDEAALAETRRLAELDRLNARAERRDDRFARQEAQRQRLAEARARDAAQRPARGGSPDATLVAPTQDPRVDQLLAEQREMRAQMTVLLSRLNQQPGATPMLPAAPAQAGSASANENAALRQEVAALRAELDALRAQLTAMNAAPRSVSAGPTAPRSTTDRGAVLDAIRGRDVTRVFFETGKATVSAEGRNAIAGAAELAKRYPDYIVIRLEGFTDKTGSQQLNQALSERRVRAVRNVLEQLGVAGSQIVVAAQGEDFDAPDLAYGRRVEVRLNVR